MAWTLRILLVLAVFAGLYWFIFFTGGDTAWVGDRAMSTSLARAVDDSKWCSYVQCGIPVAGLFGDSWKWNPFSLGYRLLFPDSISPYGWISVYFLVAFAGIFVVLMRLGASWWIAAFCGLFFAFNLQMIVYASVGHGSKLIAVSFLPWLLFAVDYLFDKKSLLAIGLLAFFFYITLISGHPQVAYYGIILIAAYCIWHRKLVQSLLCAGSLALGWAAAYSILSPVSEYAKLSDRAHGVTWAYATQWSFHPFESITYILPKFFGFGGSSYHGYMPFTEAPLYWGLAVLVFSVIAVIWVKHRLKWFLVALGLFAWVVSFGKYFPILYAPMYFLLPHFSQFRCPMLIQVLLLLSAVILAGLGMMRIKNRKLVLIVCLAGFVESVVLGKSVARPISNEAIENYYKPDSVVEYLKRDSGHFRILPLVEHHDPNWYAAQHLETVMGRLGVPTKAYRAAMDSLFPSYEFLDVASVKYVITEKPFEGIYLHEVFVGDGQYVYLYEKFKPMVRFASGGSVEWVSRTQDRLVVDVESYGEDVLIYSCSYHPDWKAFIDGEQVEVKDLNGLMMGIQIPSGRHRVVWEFDP